MKYSSLLPALLLTSLLQVAAAQDEALEAVPEPPDLPKPVQSGEVIEPDITIVRRGEETIQEYRINGRLYMVRITPAVGKPYYLVDRNGDGSMESRLSEDHERFVVPQWVLFRW